MRVKKVLMVLAAFILTAAAAWGENTLYGSYAGYMLDTGDENAFFGHNAGANVQTGSNSVYVGNWTGYCLNGSYNTAVGTGSLQTPVGNCALWGGHRNTAVGYNAGHDITSGAENVFVGKRAGESISTGSNNVFIGSEAGLSNTTGWPNTFIGNAAGHANIDGARNTYIGNSAGSANVSGSYNIFIGDHAGGAELGSNRLYIDPTSTTHPLIYGEFDNALVRIYGTLTPNLIKFNDGTTMATALTASTGADWTHLGQGAGQSNNAVNGYNTFIGSMAGSQNVSAKYNTFVGGHAGEKNVSGQSNTYIGQAAGYLSTGNGNVFLGNGAGYSETGSNILIIDNFINGGVSPLIYGEFNNKIVKINGTLITASDGRLKKNVEPLQSSLQKVTRLNGVRYEWKEEQQKGRGFGGEKEIGLIAQEVETVIPEIVHTDSSGFKAVAYDRLVPVLIEAVKEQQDRISLQQQELKEKDLRIGKLEKALDELIGRFAAWEGQGKTVAAR